MSTSVKIFEKFNFVKPGWKRKINLCIRMYEIWNSKFAYQDKIFENFRFYVPGFLEEKDAF